MNRFAQSFECLAQCSLSVGCGVRAKWSEVGYRVQVTPEERAVLELVLWEGGQNNFETGLGFSYQFLAKFRFGSDLFLKFLEQFPSFYINLYVPCGWVVEHLFVVMYLIRY